jgi:hypothetical protein
LRRSEHIDIGAPDRIVDQFAARISALPTVGLAISSFRVNDVDTTERITILSLVRTIRKVLAG